MHSHIGSPTRLLLVLTSLAVFALPFGTQSRANDDDCADIIRQLSIDKGNGRQSTPEDSRSDRSFFIAKTSPERSEVLSGLVASLQASGLHYPNVEPLVLHNLKLAGSSLSEVSQKAPATFRALKEQSEKTQGLKHHKEALDWLEKSIEEDLSSTEVLIAAGKYGTGCYHAQQTAEKALKAVLIHFQVADPKAIKKHGHDLVSILENLQKDVADPEAARWVSLTEAVSALTPLATKYRYPNPDVTQPTKEEAQNALQLAHIVVNLALSAMTPPKKP